MSRTIVCLLLFYLGSRVSDASNSTYNYSENDTLEAMQKFEESARRQWELSIRKKPTDVEEEESEHADSSPSETVELFTWFPWFEKNRPTIHTIKAIASFKKENASNFPSILGVGSWHEITLFGKKKDINSIEEPDASALCKGSANTISIFKTVLITVLLCFIAL